MDVEVCLVFFGPAIPAIPVLSVECIPTEFSQDQRLAVLFSHSSGRVLGPAKIPTEVFVESENIEKFPSGSSRIRFSGAAPSLIQG